jgi:alkaline phosphatase
MVKSICLIVLVSLICYAQGFVSPADWSDDMNADTWYGRAEAAIKVQVTKKLNKNMAKNVILYLGDGMGISTVTAGRILKGQLKKQNGSYFFDIFSKDS